MKTCSKVFLLENEISWEQVGEGIQRQILGYDGQLMLVLETPMSIFIPNPPMLLVECSNFM